jgi:hypothetical protein
VSQKINHGGDEKQTSLVVDDEKKHFHVRSLKIYKLFTAFKKDNLIL